MINKQFTTNKIVGFLFMIHGNPLGSECINASRISQTLGSLFAFALLHIV